MRQVRRARATLLFMTVIAVGLTTLGFVLSASRHSGVGLLAVAVGGLVYAFGWIIALLDSLQAGRQG